MKSTKQIVIAFFETFGTSMDWQSLIADDINFSSPMDEVAGKDPFVQLDIPFRQLVKSASIQWIISEENQASALVDYQMALPSGDTLDITFSEIIRTNGQQIQSIRVFFDTEKFKTFLSKQG